MEPPPPLRVYDPTFTPETSAVRDLAPLFLGELTSTGTLDRHAAFGSGVGIESHPRIPGTIPGGQSSVRLLFCMLFCLYPLVNSR